MSCDFGNDLHGVAEDLRTFGEFELEPYPDDRDDPSEWTLYQADADDIALMERWITVDCETAIPMEDCR